MSLDKDAPFGRPASAMEPSSLHRSFQDSIYLRADIFFRRDKMGKTDSIIDVVLSRLDQRLVPIIYSEPARNFVTDQFEPHFDDALNRSMSLSIKLARGKRTRRPARSSPACRSAPPGPVPPISSSPTRPCSPLSTSTTAWRRTSRAKATRCACQRVRWPDDQLGGWHLPTAHGRMMPRRIASTDHRAFSK